jgi:Uma2 family endonuclease
MTIQLPVHMDKAAFLTWAEGREGRYELANGHVVMMVGASRTHGLIVRNLMLILHGQLDAQQWEVIADFGLDAGPETLRYPDIVVDRASGTGGDRTASEPVLVAEVLSPSTERIDLGDKLSEYMQIASLHAYLVCAQDEPKAWLWRRGSKGFPPAPEAITGLDKIIQIRLLGVTIPLGAVYAGTDVDRR